MKVARPTASGAARNAMLCIALIVLAGCHEFPCDDALTLEPEPVPIAGDVRYTYFTSEGVQTTPDPETIPYRSRASVLIQHPDDNLPIGVVLAADLSDGVPDAATPTTHGIAARRAYTALSAGWATDIVWRRAQFVAEDLDADSGPDALTRAMGEKSPLAGLDLDAIDRKRRKRWAGALQPKLVDVGLLKAPRDIWVFDREGCYAQDVEGDARSFDVEKLEDAKLILRRLATWSGVEPTVPAIWRPSMH